MSLNSKKSEQKIIPWFSPQIGKYEYPLIVEVLKNNFPNEGPLTSKFEKSLEEILGVKHVVVVTSATAALFLALKALGIGPGDEVIVPDITFIATANAVEMSGAKAILTDIDPKTLTLDPKQFEKNITKKTRAVIPVHVSGRAAEITSIMKIARENNLFVIEDAAEAFMSKHKGRYLGTYGKMGCFSLSPAKIITTGQGGFIATNDDSIHITLKKLKDQGRPNRGTGGDDIHYSIGYNFKFTDLQAAVGLGQLHYLKERINRFRRNYQLYYEYISNLHGIKVFDFDIKNGELPLWIDVIVDEERDALCRKFSELNIDYRKFWFPIHQQRPYKQPDKKFPVSSLVSKKTLWLPSAYTLNDSDIRVVSNSIRKFFRHPLVV